ncbi:Protein of unknown function, partial [Gryllus bimaculatus]
MSVRFRVLVMHRLGCVNAQLRAALREAKARRSEQRLVSVASTAQSLRAQPLAGGAPTPSPRAEVSLAGARGGRFFHWNGL